MDVMRDIRKALYKGELYLGDHAIERMEQRGYTKSDVGRAILNGSMVETQQHPQGLRYVILGEDDGLNPIVVVVQNSHRYDIVTVMPPYDHKRFNRVI